jgi:hypothetical protein
MNAAAWLYVKLRYCITFVVSDLYLFFIMCSVLYLLSSGTSFAQVLRVALVMN